MADPSLHSNSNFISDPPKQEEEAAMGAEEPKLRPRRMWADIPEFEEADPKYKNLILELPVDPRWKMRQYQGFWLWEKTLPGFLKMQELFKPHSDDIIVASFPKSGSTWLKSLVFTIVHRNKYKDSGNPLLKLNPHDCVPFLENTYASLDEQYLETLPSPRVLGTHAPYSLLPDSIKTSKCQLIYICRDPKDILVSYWHMKKTFAFLKEVSLAECFESFCEGRALYGPIWNHVLEYYQESLQNPDKVMFLRYENMMSDPIDGVIRLANFVGAPFSEEEVGKGVVEEIVKLCSFEKLKNLDVNQKKNGHDDAKNDKYFRKAIVGDWQNHMTADMAAKLDEIVKEKLQASGFSFL